MVSKMTNSDAADDTTQHLGVDEDGDADYKAKGHVGIGMSIVGIVWGIMLAILMFFAVSPKKPSQ